ncbi:MAG: cation:proton antiporter [Candidatus Micrarchaeota archaeon]
MENEVVLNLEWVLLFAMVAGVLSVRLRLPPVAGLLVGGMIIGPNVLGLANLPTIETFAEIGSILLLFMIGVQFSVTKLLSAGLRAIISSMLLMLITFTIMHEVAILIGFDLISSLFIAAIFSLSSTAIMMRILQQKGMDKKHEVHVLVAILIIEDLIAVFMLTFFSSLKTGTANLEGMVGAAIISFGILGFSYVVLLKLLRKFAQTFMRYQAEDSIILFSFALGIGMSILASILGLSPAIGAFLAGSIMAGLPNGAEFERSIKPFGQVFSSFFFLSIGMLIDPASLLSSLGMNILLICAFMVTVFFSTMFAFFLISGSGRSSVFSGLAMLPLGEFSLLIAKEGDGLFQADVVGLASVGVLLTSVTSSLALGRSEEIYAWLKKHVPQPVLSTMRDGSGYFRNVISAFEPEGFFHSLLISEFKKGAMDLLYLVSVLLLFIVTRDLIEPEVSVAGIRIGEDVLILSVFTVFSLLPLRGILLSIKHLFDALSTIFSRTTPHTSRASIVRNLVIGGGFFMLFSNTYIIVDSLFLPDIFNWISIPIGIASALFLWSAIRASSLWLILRERKLSNIIRLRIVKSSDDHNRSPHKKTGRRTLKKHQNS